MSRTSTWGRVLKAVEVPTERPNAANDHWDRLMALRPNDMTLDDLYEYCKGRQLLVEQVTAELEQRMRDWEMAEKEFADRVRPLFKRHQIVELDPMHEDVTTDEVEQ